jgi:CRISPR-associated endonuclease/helicase Cas3
MRPGENEKAVRPYELTTILDSYRVLRDGQVLAERAVQDMMNEVFPTMPVLPPSNAYQLTEDGNYRLRKLTHQPRQTVVEVLKIEGGTCILACEQEEYRRADFRNKPKFEIPVPASFGVWNKLSIEESGSYPYVIPDDRYSFGDGSNLGLIGQKKLSPSDQII